MATVTYRCPVDPDCPSVSDRPAFCDDHVVPLERAAMTAPPPEPAADREAPAEPGPAAVARECPPVALVFRGRVLPVPADGLELGRDSPACAGVPGLAGLRQVGRHHARLYWHEGVLTVVDLTSVNGTFVDGREVRVPEPVPVGSTLRLAQDVEIAVREIDEFGMPRD
ncbi:MAG TPA: FHA domain-containing protein [Spirillospora sp.]|nr:FHA domain-containing protein [Spirillospora sp.]